MPPHIGGHADDMGFHASVSAFTPAKKGRASHIYGIAMPAGSYRAGCASKRTL